MSGGYLAALALMVTTTGGSAAWDFDLTTAAGRRAYERAFGNPWNEIREITAPTAGVLTLRHIVKCTEGTHWTAKPWTLKPLCRNGFRS